MSLFSAFCFASLTNGPIRLRAFFIYVFKGVKMNKANCSISLNRD